MAWAVCAQIEKILAENAALWLKSVVFRENDLLDVTCKPQFICKESGCGCSKLTFRSFPEDYRHSTSRLYIKCELQESPQFGGDMCSCLTAFKSDAQVKLHQTETREGLF